MQQAHVHVMLMVRAVGGEGNGLGTYLVREDPELDGLVRHPFRGLPAVRIVF